MVVLSSRRLHSRGALGTGVQMWARPILGTDTRVTAMYMYQKGDNTLDWGMPINRSGHRMNGVSREYWGQFDNVDTEQTEYNSATLRVEHDLNANTSIRNQTRRSETRRFTLLNPGGRMLNQRHAHGVPSPAGGYIPPSPRDRKSAVSGKRVSERVDLGGGRLIKKQN